MYGVGNALNITTSHTSFSIYLQLHESGSKSDSEQLGIDLYKDDYQRDVFEKNNKKSSKCADGTIDI